MVLSLLYIISSFLCLGGLISQDSLEKQNQQDACVEKGFYYKELARMVLKAAKSKSVTRSSRLEA